MATVRVNFNWQQPLADGYPNVRVPFTVAQPLHGGYPSARVNLTWAQPLQEGYPNVRADFMVVQALFPVEPEPHMATDPFPGFGNSTVNPALPAGADPASTALPGLAFSVHKKPMFKTKVTEATNGNEVRTSYTEFPRWEFELTYEFLEDRTGATSSLKTIMGFFTDMQGSFQDWLFKDPDDYLCEAAVMGEADAVTTQFYFLRYLGSNGERIGQVDTANDINLYLDGVLIDPADYTVTMPNYVVFDTAPVSGTITADFQFYFVCRFLDDEQDYEKFMDQLWSLQTCAFKSILQ